jgi:hypothetical protein
MRLYVWLNNISGVCIVQVSLLLIGQVWDISSGIGPCFPLTIGLCKFYANGGGKQPIQRQILLVQYRKQPNPLLSFLSYLNFPEFSGAQKNYLFIYLFTNLKREEPETTSLDVH